MKIMMGEEGFYLHGGGFMWVFWVLIIIGIVFLIQMMVKSKYGTSSPENESPLEILKNNMLA